MAVTRTVLPKTGLIQPAHGATQQWEDDNDANWALLDNLLATFGQFIKDAGLNGVYSGFALSSSGTLTPGLTTGVLYAQGERYAPASAPNPGAAPASSTRYLFYNSSTGFYYSANPFGATAGDALIGKVVTNASQVTSVTNATKVFGQVSLTPGAFGNFTVEHLLGRTPKGAVIQMTSDGAIWFQTTMYDNTNLYLTASDAGITGKVLLW